MFRYKNTQAVKYLKTPITTIIDALKFIYSPFYKSNRCFSALLGPKKQGLDKSRKPADVREVPGTNPGCSVQSENMPLFMVLKKMLSKLTALYGKDI